MNSMENNRPTERPIRSLNPAHIVICLYMCSRNAGEQEKRKPKTTEKRYVKVHK